MSSQFIAEVVHLLPYPFRLSLIHSKTQQSLLAELAIELVTSRRSEEQRKMGGGASKEHAELLAAVEEEHKKPVEGDDIDTPRGVSAKEEVKRLRKLIAKHAHMEATMAKALMGSAPSLSHYLEYMFRKADKDSSSSLSKEEFWDLMKGLHLNLSEEDIQRLQEMTDKDNDENISLEEFIKSAPQYFKELMQGEETPEVKEREWAQLEDEEGNTYYYNKRTGESQWEAPKAFVLAAAEDAAEQEKTMSPDLKEYISQMFRSSDLDASGNLSSEEFWSLIQNQLNLGFTDDQFYKLQSKCDIDQDGYVKWSEFVLIAPDLIKSLYDESDEADCWVEQIDDQGNKYYINTKTGASQWEQPEKFKPLQDLEEAR